MTTQFKTGGHTEWCEGRVHHTGFTTTLPPNTFVGYRHADKLYDVDYTSWQEGRDGRDGRPTYAAVTARSCHNGIVNAAFMDGSIRSIDDNIDLSIWGALGTRAGNEQIGF